MKKQLTREEVLERDLVNRLEQARGKIGWDTEYVKKIPQPILLNKCPIKPIAFYLPQFHPIPENNEWWGKGFTEWTNVSKAIPQFLGHYQPHLPGEMGFYDLRLPEVMNQQAELAKYYGIYGFCFHYYWFNGKKLLETPLQLFLKNTGIEINFCVSWANENWTRRWDGLENEVLITQNYSDEDDIRFIDELIPLFNDPRYIKIDGAPVLLLYRLSLLSDPKATINRWRARAASKGIQKLHIVGVKSFDIEDPTKVGADAAVEFPPHQVDAKTVNDLHVLNPNFSGSVFDYADVAERVGKRSYSYPCYKTVMPSWDNEARKPGKGIAFINSTPLNFSKWVRDACETTLRTQPPGRFLFINAWNEWGEGAHLEPDRKYGYAYLHSLSSTLANYSDYSEQRALVEKLNSTFEKKSNNALLIHLFYYDYLDVLSEKLNCFQDFDVFISVMRDAPLAVLNKIASLGLNVRVELIENRGRDIRPFLGVYSLIKSMGYSLACKIHTKKSPHRSDGVQWGNQLIDSLAKDAESVNLICEKFKDIPELGILVPQNSIVDLSIPEIHLGNVFWLGEVSKHLGLDIETKQYQGFFSAGSMFWFRVEALELLEHLKVFDERFEMEVGQLDGTLAHAIERLFCILAQKSGYNVESL